MSLFLAAHWLQKKLLLSWYRNQKQWDLRLHSKPLPPTGISPHLLFSLFIIFCFIEAIFIDQRALLPWYLWASRNAWLISLTYKHTGSLLTFSMAGTLSRLMLQQDKIYYSSAIYLCSQKFKSYGQGLFLLKNVFWYIISFMIFLSCTIHYMAF